MRTSGESLCGTVSCPTTPLLQIVFGGVLIAIGLFGGALTLSEVAAGRFSSFHVGLSLPLFLGAYVVYDATRRGYFLHVETTGGRKTLNFRGKPGVPELRAFVATAAERFGYQVDDELLRG